MLDKKQAMHFTGIGGAGMSGLAEIMHQRTRGNLRAMDSLALTLSSTLRSRPASEKDIRRCLALRSTDRDPLQLQFQLSA